MQLNTDINYRLQHAAKPDHSGGGGGGAECKLWHALAAPVRILLSGSGSGSLKQSPFQHVDMW